MVDKSWKATERSVTAWFGLKRRGADFGDRSGGKSDAVNHDGSESDTWCIEVKHLRSAPASVLLAACKQAEAAALGHQEPVVVWKPKGYSDKDAFVIQRLETFAQYRLKSPADVHAERLAQMHAEDSRLGPWVLPIRLPPGISRAEYMKHRATYDAFLDTEPPPHSLGEPPNLWVETDEEPPDDVA